MKRSTERILTTHTGSLPRPSTLVEAMFAKEEGKPIEAGTFANLVQSAVAETVRAQVATGIDIVSDGEMGKVGFANYVKDRLTGFGGESTPWLAHDVADHPDLAKRLFRGSGDVHIGRPACNGPISVRDPEAVQRDIQTFTAALQGMQVEGAFLAAASPGVIAQVMQNTYYPTQEAYLYAIAEAMKHEYQAIVAAGLILQVDCPDLAMNRHILFANASLDEFRRHVGQSIEVLNYALVGLPSDQIRIHVCWGNYPGPHHRDVELKDILDLLLEIRGDALSLESANPRHEHEWQVFEGVKLPEGKLLIPGMIDSCTNYIEHPQVVAQRIVRFAHVVGRENVVAGTDCGFGTFVGVETVAPSVVWAKLGSLVEGTRLASEELW